MGSPKDPLKVPRPSGVRDDLVLSCKTSRSPDPWVTDVLDQNNGLKVVREPKQPTLSSACEAGGTVVAAIDNLLPPFGSDKADLHGGEGVESHKGVNRHGSKFKGYTRKVFKG